MPSNSLEVDIAGESGDLVILLLLLLLLLVLLLLAPLLLLLQTGAAAVVRSNTLEVISRRSREAWCYCCWYCCGAHTYSSACTSARCCEGASSASGTTSARASCKSGLQFCC